MSELSIIEINGIKLEVDLRNAKKIEHFKVGDNVKVLVKEYSDSYKSHPGVIIGFDDFQEMPTIVICYVCAEWSKAEIKFCYLNKSSKGIEICHMMEHEKSIDKTKAIDYLDAEILKKQNELDDLKYKKSYFLEKYNEHFKK